MLLSFYNGNIIKKEEGERLRSNVLSIPGVEKKAMKRVS